MERKGGVAAIAVLVAILGFSFVPRRGGESAGPAQHAQVVRGAKAARPATTKLKNACQEISERVSRFYTSEIHYPSSCYENETQDDSAFVSKDIPGIPDFAIALVPNPAQTNLPVVFDRLIEAIQQAGQDENYSYDGSWFPWTEEKTYDRFGDEEKAEALQSELQQQPGVIAFRRNTPKNNARAAQNPGTYDGGLLVFVVGEQPTGGIDDEQFEHAMDWLKKLGADSATNGLHILGPTFSGSLPSLQRELTKAHVEGQLDLSKVMVYSGTANSNESIDRFKRFICDSEQTDPNDSNPCPNFRTFLESDNLMTHRFLQFAHRNGYCLRRVAVLSEDETAFGAESLRTSTEAGEDDHKSCKDEERNITGSALEERPIYLYYPRDIANLRSAYSKQSIFSRGKQQDNAPSSTLRGDLGEAATSEHDTVQAYSGDLTPYVQEATLFGIINVLQANRVQFIVIRSSNSLDQLFLAEFLRRSYPSGRVVLDGADLLFRSGMEGESLRGVMLLSTYPLMARARDQIPPVKFVGDNYQVVAAGPTKSYRIFGDELSEGLYIAARGLLNTSANPTSVADYGSPLARLGLATNPDDDLRPATWLTVVGHRQFWPVAVLNDATLPNQCPPKIPPAPTCPTKAQVGTSNANPEADACNTNATCDCTETNGALLLPAYLCGQDAAAGPSKNANSQQGLPFPADTTALVLLCCVLGLVHFLLCWKGRMIGRPAVRAYFAPIPLGQQPALIFIGSLLIAATAVTIAGATGLVEQFYTGHQAGLLWFGLILLVSCGFGGLLANYRLLDPKGEEAATKTDLSAQQEVAKAAAAGVGNSSAGGTYTTPSSEETAATLPRVNDAASSDARIDHAASAIRQPETAKVNNQSTRDVWAPLGRTCRYVRDLLVEPLVHLRDGLANRKIGLARLASYWVACLAVLVGIRWYLNSHFTNATKLSAFWRNSHISNGVSGLLPQVLLLLGFYAWFWYNLRGLSLFGEDRPVLPSRDSLPECFHRTDKDIAFESQDDRHDRKLPSDPSGARLFAMFSAEQAGALIEEAAHPLNGFYLWTYIPILVASASICFLVLGEQVVQTLGEQSFGLLIFSAMSVAIALILADALQFARTWGRLRQLLVFLDRLRLRRTLASLKGLSWKSVLSMSSNVLEERYCLISRQLESARNLQTTLGEWQPGDATDEEHKRIAIAELVECEGTGLKFAEQYTVALGDPSSENVKQLKCALMAYQQEVAKTAGRVMTHIILPSWQRESHSLILETKPAGKGDDDKEETRAPLAEDPHVQAAEEFFVLPYLGFIQNIMGRVRTIVIAILLLFTATTLALSSYPFSPTPALGAIFLVLFVLVGGMVVLAYAEMHRDATLSHITQSQPGQLGFEFWGRIVSFGIGPLIGLLTTLFPSITDFVVSWLQPGAEAMK